LWRLIPSPRLVLISTIIVFRAVWARPHRSERYGTPVVSKIWSSVTPYTASTAVACQQQQLRAMKGDFDHTDVLSVSSDNMNALCVINSRMSCKAQIRG
jgi:hypothetical protein